MKHLKIGGVPEHFNYPWHYALENELFGDISVKWTDVPGGSGAMCKMLDEGELDIALVLTEGVVKHIAGGSGIRIIQQYVKSPLIWGVHSSMRFANSVNELSKARFARSRKGSGSHLMAYVHAEQNGYQIREENFVDVGNIHGALKAFEENEADILLWEKFMTQPYVDAGQTKRIAECVSPWPCFVMVASEQALKTKVKEIKEVSEKILLAVSDIMNHKQAVELISEKYSLQIDQTEQWFSQTEWQTSEWVSSRMLENVVNTLYRIDIISRKLSAKEMCYINAKLY